MYVFLLLVSTAAFASCAAKIPKPSYVHHYIEDVYTSLCEDVK